MATVCRKGKTYTMAEPENPLRVVMREQHLDVLNTGLPIETLIHYNFSLSDPISDLYILDNTFWRLRSVFESHSKHGRSGYVINMIASIASIPKSDLTSCISSIMEELRGLMGTEDGQIVIRQDDEDESDRTITLSAKEHRFVWVGVMYMSMILPHVGDDPARAMFDYLIRHDFLIHAFTFDCLVMIIQATSVSKANDLTHGRESTALFDHIMRQAAELADVNDRYLLCCAIHAALLTPGVSDMCDRPSNPKVIASMLTAISPVLQSEASSDKDPLYSSLTVMRMCVWKSIAWSEHKPHYVNVCLRTREFADSVDEMWVNIRTKMMYRFPNADADV